MMPELIRQCYDIKLAVLKYSADIEKDSFVNRMKMTALASDLIEVDEKIKRLFPLVINIHRKVLGVNEEFSDIYSFSQSSGACVSHTSYHDWDSGNIHESFNNMQDGKLSSGLYQEFLQEALTLYNTDIHVCPGNDKDKDAEEALLKMLWNIRNERGELIFDR